MNSLQLVFLTSTLSACCVTAQLVNSFTLRLQNFSDQLATATALNTQLQVRWNMN